MTINEIIKRLRFKAENIKAKLEPIYFSECADYLEKYAWHDLRKNPDDLPKTPTVMLVLFEKEGIHKNEMWLYPCVAYYVSELAVDEDYMFNGWYRWSLEQIGDIETYMTEEVVAWREIEPYEGEKE